jgi:hypothetical protein
VRGSRLLSRGWNRPGVLERAKLRDRSDVLPRRPRRRRRRGCRRLHVRDHVREGRDARLRDCGRMSGRGHVPHRPRGRRGGHLPSGRGSAAEGRGRSWLTSRLGLASLVASAPHRGTHVPSSHARTPTRRPRYVMTDAARRYVCTATRRGNGGASARLQHTRPEQSDRRGPRCAIFWQSSSLRFAQARQGRRCRRSRGSRARRSIRPGVRRCPSDSASRIVHGGDHAVLGVAHGPALRSSSRSACGAAKQDWCCTVGASVNFERKGSLGCGTSSCAIPRLPACGQANVEMNANRSAR